MKSRFSVSLFALLTALTFARPAGAQPPTSVPPSPAYGVAERIRTQAEYEYTQSLEGGVSAAEHKRLARLRANQAINKYKEVVSSKMYRNTWYAAESLYYQAHLQETVLDSKANAVADYKTLHNQFQTVPYDDKIAADTNLQTAEQALDKENRTKFPSSLAYTVMDTLVKLWGGPKFGYSYFLAILTISILVKLALTPLTNKQYAMMKEQQKLQPLIKELQAKYKDKEEQGRKMMELYKERGINPAASCLPLFAQLPIMYLLWYTISVYQYQFSQGSFLWIGSGYAHQFPSFLGVDLSQPDIPILLLYALSMFIQQRMMISPDPQQAEQQRMMAIMTPFMSTYFFLQYKLSSAFILYYLIFNILGTAQQYYYMKKRAGEDGSVAVVATDGAPAPPAVRASTNGAAKPTSARTGLAPKSNGKKKRR
jgi:YidC/Oxa1 family membrane protein insertase